MNTLVPLMLYLALGCVQLALVQKQTVQVDSNFDDFTKNTLKRERDVTPHKKEKIRDKKDIFYYNNEPCPSKILIEGGPGVGAALFSKIKKFTNEQIFVNFLAVKILCYTNWI